MKAIGWIRSWEDLPSERGVAAHYDPNTELTGRYEGKFRRFKRIYQHLYEEETE
jgi:hypothetical protein